MVIDVRKFARREALSSAHNILIEAMTYGPSVLRNRGDLHAWPEVLERLIGERGVTDIVLFGDCRPLHRAAIGVARELHVQVHVFEEGYIRPDWVTLEVGGVNGHSTLPKDPEYYVEAARHLPPVPLLLVLPLADVPCEAPLPPA